ncbi:growth/differentiation factor 6-A-like [Pristis pectinata]|uniref:growth/differentiation factor 6-A-like n=1 Tax=Pristis pectinata TaxID=685728 RepID=UPI00223E7AA5|nr:growth/differentiation factor 6-A-like [Pristis pectinata]
MSDLRHPQVKPHLCVSTKLPVEIKIMVTLSLLAVRSFQTPAADVCHIAICCKAATLGSLQDPTSQDGPGSSSPLDSKHDQTFKRQHIRTGTVVPHEYMMSLYRTLSECERKGLNSSLARADPVPTLLPARGQGNDGAPLEKKQRYLFDISKLPNTEELVGAELRIFRKLPGDLHAALSLGGSMYRILLYSCPERGDSPPKPLDSRTVDILDVDSSRWQVFDVWELMKSHITANLLCLDVEIISDYSQKALDPRLLGFNRSDLQPQEKALLVAFSNTKKRENLFREIREKIRSLGGSESLQVSREPSVKRRRKRRTAFSSRSSRGSGKKARSRCSRKPLHVNFKELGWDDWIIAPLDYEAYHCEGICDFPLRSHLEPTNHAIIQTLMNSMDPESTPPSCCVPSRLSPISILYIDSGNNVVYKQYEDMVVESCGCR